VCDVDRLIHPPAVWTWTLPAEVVSLVHTDSIIPEEVRLIVRNHICRMGVAETIREFSSQIDSIVGVTGTSGVSVAVLF
jgi:hypothetical protein